MIDYSLTVGDENDGFTFPAQVVEVLEQGLLGGGVKSRSGLVQKQYAAGVQKGAGYGNPLALAFRESGAALTAEALKAIGKLKD